MPSTITDPQVDNDSIDDSAAIKSKTTADTDSTLPSPYTYSAFIDRLHSTSCLTVITHIRKYVETVFWIDAFS